MNSNRSKPPPDWVNSVLRCTYNDGLDIRETLDKLLGEKGYILKQRNGRWVVWAPRSLSKADKSELESAYVHY